MGMRQLYRRLKRLEGRVPEDEAIFSFSEEAAAAILRAHPDGPALLAELAALTTQLMQKYPNLTWNSRTFRQLWLTDARACELLCQRTDILGGVRLASRASAKPAFENC